MPVRVIHHPLNPLNLLNPMNPHAAGVSNGVSRHHHPRAKGPSNLRTLRTLSPFGTAYHLPPASGGTITGGRSPVNPHTEGVSIIKNIYKHYKIKSNISHSFLCPRRKQKRRKARNHGRFHRKGGLPVLLREEGGMEKSDKALTCGTLDFTECLWYPVPRPRSHPRDGSQG